MSCQCKALDQQVPAFISAERIFHAQSGHRYPNGQK